MVQFYTRFKIAPHAVLLLVGALLLANSHTLAQPSTPTVSAERFLDLETIPLWPAGAPRAVGNTPADAPSLTVFKPQLGHANGASVIVAPGGGYFVLASNIEGRQVADWFAAHGVTAYVLNYRLGARYPLPTPLRDAQRAIRVVRSLAHQGGMATDRIGMIGFSSGGHLVALAGTSFSQPDPAATDPIDRLSDRPDFLVLAYAALTFDPATYCREIGLRACDTLASARLSPDALVSADTPPTFLYHTSDDNSDVAEKSIRFYRALRAHGVAAEMHIFAHGEHGSGLGGGDANLDLWPVLLENWLRTQGYLAPAVAPILPAAIDEGQYSLDSSFERLMTYPPARTLLVQALGPENMSSTLFQRIAASPLPARAILPLFLAVTETQIRALDQSLRALRH